MNDYCAMCGKPAEAKHHLIFGMGMRKLADDDKIYIPICNNCHNMSIFRTEQIHENPSAEKLSKMLGQYMWMLNQVADAERQEELQKAFLERYGRRYI